MLTFHSADPSTSMFSDDTDLARAIAESRAQAGLPPQQSSIGVTNEVHFGPANQNESHYEKGEWDLVLAGQSSTSAQEVLLDPEPADRKRDLNAPAFLKPSLDDHRLGALFTIYHEIPLLREVFLNRSDVQHNYGQDPEWWTGKAIEYPWVKSTESQSLLFEIQRLMAFLSKTDRSYGSAEALANLPAVEEIERRHWGTIDKEAMVLNAWKKAFEDRETGQIGKVFSLGVSGDGREETTHFAILDLALPQKDSGAETLYDIADKVLWPQTDQDTNLSNCAYLEHIGEVIAFRLERDEDSSSVEIPPVWYPDRYLKSGRDAALNMRLAKLGIEHSLKEACDKESILTTHTTRSGRVIMVKDMIASVLKRDAHETKQSDGVNSSQDSSDREAVPLAEEASNLSTELHKLLANIDQKLLGMLDRL
jgi:hypothetical protein